MQIHFTPEEEDRLAEIATYKGTSPESMVKDAALRLLEEDEQFRAAVRKGIAEADRGELIDEDDMDARIKQMLEQ